MSLFWLIYLIDLIESVRVFSLLACAVLLLAAFAHHIWWDVYAEHGTPYFDKQFKCGLVVLFFLSIVCVVVPSKSTMYLMTTVKYSEAMLAGEIPQKALKVLELKLDELVKGEGNP